MEVVKINDEFVDVPTNWQELEKDRDLFIYVINLFFKEYTKQQIRNIAGLKMCGMKDAKIQQITDAIKTPERHDNIESISLNLFVASELAKFVTTTPLILTKNHFPSIGKKVKFFAPGAILKDCSVYEYALAEKSFFDFMKSNKEEHLNELVAVLYRPKRKFLFVKKRTLKYDGDVRQPFSDNLFEKRLEKIKQIDFATKWLIFRWFTSEREQIIKMFPLTFPKGNKKKEKKRKNIGAVWTDTILAMSQIGDEEKTVNTKLSIILHRIEIDNRNYQEMKKQQEKLNKK